MAYDTTLGKIVMFGGRNDSESAVLNDTWIFDGSNWTQLFPATPPPGRAFDVPGMTYDSAQGNVMFFGGAGFGVYFDDTWTFDGTNWTQQFPATSPSTRRAPQVYDPATGTVRIFFPRSRPIDTSEKEAVFITHFGSLNVRAKFRLAAMKYHGAIEL